MKRTHVINPFQFHTFVYSGSYITVEVVTDLLCSLKDDLMSKIFNSERKIDKKVAVTEKRVEEATKELVLKVASAEKRVEAAEQKIDTLAGECDERHEKDLYVFADHSERADFGSNLLKGNCVLITGAVKFSFKTIDFI